MTTNYVYPNIVHKYKNKDCSNIVPANNSCCIFGCKERGKATIGNAGNFGGLYCDVHFEEIIQKLLEKR